MQMLIAPGSAEQTVHKSRFYAWAAYCEDERAVKSMLHAIATQHAHASHLVYAFRLHTPNGVVSRFSDAGEPSGTAGKPIFQYLEGRDLINVCVAVIRYYGGVNLGKGGLVRAYGGTAKQALDQAQIAPYVVMQRVKLEVDYKRWDELLRELAVVKGVLLEKNFAERISVYVSVSQQEAKNFLQRFNSEI